MASNLMLDDRLQIDRFNPTTWTGDFGVNKDGFRKDLFIDGSYTRAIDEVPTDYTDDLQNKPRDLSGNVYLKTIDPNYAPHDSFPTRKYEYSDGTVTWYRPEQPWSWMNGGGAGGSVDIFEYLAGFFKTTKNFRKLLVILVVVIILMYLLSNMKV